MTALLQRLAAIEILLQAATPESLGRASSLALIIARSAPTGHCSHLAMRLMSAIENRRRPAARGAPVDGGPDQALWRLRTALEETASTAEADGSP